MNSRALVGCLVIAVALPFTIRADQEGDRRDRDDREGRGSEHHERTENTRGFDRVIQVPGNPIVSADIAWVDPGTERYYLADRSNAGVDIIDAENNFYVGRVPGMAGCCRAVAGPPSRWPRPERRVGDAEPETVGGGRE